MDVLNLIRSRRSMLKILDSKIDMTNKERFDFRELANPVLCLSSRSENDSSLEYESSSDSRNSLT